MIPILSVLRQSMLIPAPPLTEKNIGSLAGKTVLVTGGNSGVGFDLCAILYGAGARVFLAGRNEASGREAIEKIRAQAAASPAGATAGAAGGELEFLQLDLSDLSTIKASAEDFLARADALHFLCNNAGVMQPPKGSKGKQGHELQVVTNCLGTYLFTDLITPRLVETARAEKAKGEENGVRVAWAGSSAIDVYSPRDGVKFEKDADDGLERQAVLGPTPDYGQSKTGNLFLATAYGERVAKDGIVSTCFNPGNLWTNLTRHVAAGVPAGVSNFLHRLILYPSIYGAYTELYCGFGRDLTVADNGAFVAPWGRKWYVRGDIERSRTGELRTRYMEYVEREVKPYR